MTNYERIKAMSVKEIAEELIIYRYDWGDYETHAGCFYEYDVALEKEIKWLEQEANKSEMDKS